MSHYAVAVFTNTDSAYEIDSLMEPYSESDERYFTFHPIDIEEEYKRYKTFLKDNPDSNYSFAEYLDYSGYKKQDDQYGAYYNDNATYDYYTIDGRDYMYEPKPGEKLEDGQQFYRKNQLDFLHVDQEDLKEQTEFWENFVEGKKKNTNSYFKREYYLERYGTKEQFVKEATYNVPYAFVTPDGVWHAPGKVGWFACSDETKESFNAYLDEWLKYILDTSINPFVSILDCHI